MSALKRLLARTVNVVTARRRDARLQEEIRDHVRRHTVEHIRAGMPPEEARRRAALAFGSVEATREIYHAEEGFPFAEELFQDLRSAARVLRRSPGFTGVAVLSLALAIGANTTIFSAATALLEARVAIPHAASLRLLSWTGTKDHVAVHNSFDDSQPLPGGLVTSPSFSYPVYEQLRAGTRSLGDLVAVHGTGMNVTVGDDTERVAADEVSGNYYTVLGVRPQAGRGIEQSDDTPTSRPVAVISDELWTSEFGRSTAAIGQWVTLNNVPAMIVGVNPKGFTGVRSVLPAEAPDVTTSLAMQPILTPAANGQSLLTNPQEWWVDILGRAEPGVPDSAAEAALDTELSAIVRATMPVREGEDIPRLVVGDGSRGLFDREHLFVTRTSVLMMFVGLVLLLACANITTLMLARGAERRREMTLRLALGAGRARLVRQMLVESLLLAGIGGTGGLVMGYLGRTAIPRWIQNAWQPASLPVHFDWWAFTFTAAITIFTGVLCGLAPALAATRADVTSGLKDGTHTTTRRRKGPAGKAVVAFQIALSTLLVIGAGLFIRTLAELNAVDPGFRTDHLLLAGVPLPQNRYAAGASIAFHQRLEQAIGAMPGVVFASLVADEYLSESVSHAEFLPENEARDQNTDQTETYNVVGVHFFETLGIPIVAGRAFGDEDTATSPAVGVVNEALAKARFAGRNPIGRRFAIGTPTGAHGEIFTRRMIEIVGVCGDTRDSGLDEQPSPQFFVPYVQQTQVRRMSYAVRTTVKPEAILPDLRRVVHAADPALPLVDVRTQQDQIDSDLEGARLFVTLTSGFGLLALALASIGIYGVMAYSVARRTQEIGIRLALGALPRQVLAMVLREALWLSAAGIATGVGASLLLGRIVRSMLYGIAPYDPITLAGAAWLLLTVALGASWIPARRAAGVERLARLE